MIDQETWDGVNSCVKVMKKLDAGESILPGSAEHKALIWGVLTLINDNLIDHSPLSPEDLGRAKEVVARFNAAPK